MLTLPYRDLENSLHKRPREIHIADSLIAHFADILRRTSKISASYVSTLTAFGEGDSLAASYVCIASLTFCRIEDIPTNICLE